jgi:AcrR family transcriptional regulator
MPNNVRGSERRLRQVHGGPLIPGAVLDRRSRRREETRAEIVAAAWRLARREGLAGIALRDLAALVGLKAPSLYSYFPSKHAIYDAMFRDGYEAFAATMQDAAGRGSPRARARRAVRTFFRFCTEDPVRFQLLFQRTIPDFEPSPDSYAVAQVAYRAMAADLASIGVTDARSVDLWTAVTTGLVSQQVANDPGGSRWERLIDRSVDMLLAATVSSSKDGSP